MTVTWTLCLKQDSWPTCCSAVGLNALLCDQKGLMEQWLPVDYRICSVMALAKVDMHSQGKSERQKTYEDNLAPSFVTGVECLVEQWKSFYIRATFFVESPLSAVWLAFTEMRYLDMDSFALVFVRWEAISMFFCMLSAM